MDESRTPSQLQNVTVGALKRCQGVVEPVVKVLDSAGIGSRLFTSKELCDLVPDLMERLERNSAPEAILLSPTGNDVCIAANKFAGIRAVVVQDPLVAKRSRERLASNVLCLPADLLGGREIAQIVHAWVSTHPPSDIEPKPVKDLKQIDPDPSTPD